MWHNLTLSLSLRWLLLPQALACAGDIPHIARTPLTLRTATQPAEVPQADAPATGLVLENIYSYFMHFMATVAKAGPCSSQKFLPILSHMCGRDPNIQVICRCFSQAISGFTQYATMVVPKASLLTIALFHLNMHS